jgi:hypothetical protein
MRVARRIHSPAHALSILLGSVLLGPGLDPPELSLLGAISMLKKTVFALGGMVLLFGNNATRLVLHQMTLL